MQFAKQIKTRTFLMFHLQAHDHTNLEHCFLHREIKKVIKGRFRWFMGHENKLLWNHHF